MENLRRNIQEKHCEDLAGLISEFRPLADEEIEELGVGTTDFDIDGGKKDALIASGREGTIRYFDDWFNNSAKAVVNRP
jgi:hypothetical protein